MRKSSNILRKKVQKLKKKCLQILKKKLPSDATIVPPQTSRWTSKNDKSLKKRKNFFQSFCMEDRILIYKNNNKK